MGNLSFSTLVKNELCRVEQLCENSMMAELSGVLAINAKKISIPKGKVKIITENAAFARNIFTLFKRLFGVSLNVSMRKSMRLKKHTVFILNLYISENEWKRLNDIFTECTQISQEDSTFINLEMTDDTYTTEFEDENIIKCRRAFLRGIFLAAGSMSDPEKTYHLEINTHSQDAADIISSLINNFDLHARISKRKSHFVVYLKEGENIVDFLNIIGAHSSLLDLENVRIMKEMRNNVNRIVNCETANLDKTVDAAIKQVENITIIKNRIGLDKLPKPLLEVATLRIEYPDANLKELGELLSPPLGKSGVNHRLRKIEEMAERLKTRS